MRIGVDGTRYGAMRLKLLAMMAPLSGFLAGVLLLAVTCATAAPLLTEFNGVSIPQQTLPDFAALAAKLSNAVVNLSAH